MESSGDRRPTGARASGVIRNGNQAKARLPLALVNADRKTAGQRTERLNRRFLLILGHFLQETVRHQERSRHLVRLPGLFDHQEIANPVPELMKAELRTVRPTCPLPRCSCTRPFPR